MRGCQARCVARARSDHPGRHGVGRGTRFHRGARRSRAADRPELHARAQGRRGPAGHGARRRHRAAVRGAPDRALARRCAPQGQGGRAGVERHHPADRDGRPLGQGPGTARRHRRLSIVGQADHRLPGVRRRAGVLPCERVRQGLPDADGLAGPDRHFQLRALPPRHARQDRRLSRRAAHRRFQDRVRTP